MVEVTNVGVKGSISGYELPPDRKDIRMDNGAFDGLTGVFMVDWRDFDENIPSKHVQIPLKGRNIHHRIVVGHRAGNSLDVK